MGLDGDGPVGKDTGTACPPDIWINHWINQVQHPPTHISTHHHQLAKCNLQSSCQKGRAHWVQLPPQIHPGQPWSPNLTHKKSHHFSPKRDERLPLLHTAPPSPLLRNRDMVTVQRSLLFTVSRSRARKQASPAQLSPARRRFPHGEDGTVNVVRNYQHIHHTDHTDHTHNLTVYYMSTFSYN